jgi:hypothetical protein
VTPTFDAAALGSPSRCADPGAFVLSLLPSVRLTILEPSAYNASFFHETSLRRSTPVTDYDPIRAKLQAMADPSSFGDPHATARAVLAVVDHPSPPLRLVLGATSLPLIRAGESVLARLSTRPLAPRLLAKPVARS